VNLWTLGNWERERTEPRSAYLPAIYAFLGYCPIPPAPRTLGERLVAWRRAQGLSREAAATRFGIYRGTLSKIERGEVVTGRLLAAVERAIHGARE